MMINKSNYEAYLLDYLEGSISTQDREALLLFFDLNPQLKSELDTDISLCLNPKAQLADDFKEQLLKHEADVYDLPVSDYLFIKKQEEGLSKTEQSELLLIEPNKHKQEKISLDYQKTILRSDTTVLYDDKSKLRRFALFPVFKQYVIRRSIAAAAIIAVFASVWFITETPDISTPQVANTVTSHVDELEKPIVAESKILEKPLPDEKQPSKDSLLKLANDPMELKKESAAKQKPASTKNANYLASIGHIKPLNNHKINAYEHGLNVMMPQYMNNNLLREELASIYRKIEVDESSNPSISFALLEGGVKVMNFLSKESVKMQKYYNDNGEVVGYKVKGENLELNRKVK
ncbi:hypothetical protein J1N10_11830 [Carboxylicivirga sp. A043]|uniref:hypothetical protein n=1 Tax=Carboxylicivirga litoralis TaxID=2816963 RepID=UPI0021CB5A24|nr:hypothetical protein [Carboxylicivirga sp. A043]MCU4156668.1 hypothetical protein [Carboxylicivirga sp. A043]